MKIKLDITDSKVVKSNETYDVIDNTSLNNLVVSKTILHYEKETGGHNHKGQEEVYIFVKGQGKMYVGPDENFGSKSDRLEVGKGDIILIPDGFYHKVWNDRVPDLEFICVFGGGRNH